MIKFPDEFPAYSIQKHETAEAVLREFYSGAFSDTGCTLEELGIVGMDNQGNEVELTFHEQLDALQQQNVWGFVDASKNPTVIHFWVNDATDESLMEFFGHELGHIAMPDVQQIGKVPFESISDATNGAEFLCDHDGVLAAEEFNADLFGLVAKEAYRLTKQVQSENTPKPPSA